jgi:hypothetical protein
MIGRNVSELMNDINIYTGIITRVGTYHIECKYNAYQGCSGGPAIAADERYTEYRSKAIAIYDGCP